MVTLTVEKGSVPTPGQGSLAIRQLGLRVAAAALQILATVAVVQVLPPNVAGVYFKGFVIAYGLSALLRGKYDLFVAQHFLSDTRPRISDRALVRGLGLRVLVRSIIACAVLLVITSDADVMEPHLRPYLETYLPFVLAVPFMAVAWFLASVLKAVNHTASSSLLAAFSVNIIMVLIVNTMMGSTEDLFVALSWGFFASALLAAALGVVITSRVFPAHSGFGDKADRAAWQEVYTAAARHGLTGIALACLQWGPLCVLALLSPEAQIAHYAVATRTAQVIDFLIPAAILVPHGFLLHSKFADKMQTSHGKLIVDLMASAGTSALCVLAVVIAMPWIMDLYGASYEHLTPVFVLLFAMQWVNGAGRPAIRHIAASWDNKLVRRILFLSMAVAMVTCLPGIPAYGALGAAFSVLAGALMMNGQALRAAFAGCKGC